MPICEVCSVSFQEADGPVEVVTTRVLCPSCLADYQKAKAARKAAAAGRTTAPSATSGAPPPRNSSPHAPRAAASEVPKSIPVKPLNSVPATRAATPPAARPAAPASKKVALPPAPAANDAPPSPAPVAKKPALAPPPATARKPLPKKRSTDVEFIHRETEALRKRESRIVWIGAGLALVMLLVAGGVVWVVLGKRAKDEAIQQAHRDEVAAFYTTFMAIDITTEEGCTQAIAFADEKRSLWEPEDIAPEVQSRYAKAKTTLDLLVEKKSLLERLAQVEATLGDPSAVPADQLLEIRRVIDDLEAKGSVIGTEALARLGTARGLADKAYATRLLEEARASAAAEGGRAALTKFARAEEEIYKILEKAARAKAETQPFYQDLYQSAIKDSDALAASVFDEAAIEGTPWRDLLASTESANWLAPALQGFEHRLENGTLHLIGPAPEAGARGIISIGDKEQWRDFVVDFEFTIQKGSFEMYFRLGPSLQDKTQWIEYGVDDSVKTPKNAGEKYSTTISVIGSTFVWTEEGLAAPEDQIHWSFRRKGAVGIVVPEGAEVIFTKMRIRVLR
jgi:hypothetical protein